jgi:multidrug efflux pump subunit AcrB
MGIYSYMNSPKEIFPPMSMGKIIVSGSYSNGSIDNINKSIVSPIEDDLKNITGINKIESKIQNGSFNIILTLDKNQDKLSIIDKIKSAIDKNKRYFPKNFITPSVQELIFSIPVGFIALSDGSEAQMMELSKKIKQDLLNIHNVSKINIYGQKDKIISISLKSKVIELLGLSKVGALNSISSLYNLSQIGKIEGSANSLFISSKNEDNLEIIKNSLLNISGKYIYFKDIANIKYGYMDNIANSSFNLKKSINIEISKNKYGDAITIRDKIFKIIKKYQKLEKEIQIGYFLDSTVFIINRLNTVISNIFFGILLVTLLVYFLVNKRIAFIVFLGIPTSFIIGLIFLNISGYSINMITLLGALMILGVIVDDAIIVAENIQRHLESGKDTIDAIKVGVSEVFTPVLTASLTTIFSFVPMLVLSGEMGAFIKMIPVAITVLIIASVLECFIFLPIHSKHIISKNDKELNWEPLKIKYQNLISFLVTYKYRVFISILVIVPLLSIFTLSSLKYVLFPSFDSNQYYVRGSFDINYSKEDVAVNLRHIEEAIYSKKDDFSIKSISSVYGMKINNRGEPEFKEYFFNITISLNNKIPDNFVEKFIVPYLSLYYNNSNRVRELGYDDIVAKSKTLISSIKNTKGLKDIEVIKEQAGLIENDIEIQFFHENKLIVEKAIKKIKNKIQTLKGILSAKDDIKYGILELKIQLNDYAKSIGITKNNLASSLSAFYLDYEITSSTNKNGILKVISKDIDKNNLENFKNFHIENKGKFIQLKDICTFIEIRNYDQIYKLYGKEIKSVFANVDKAIITPREALEEITPLLDELRKTGIDISIKGEEEQNEQLIKELSFSFLIAIFCIFIALLILFNSFRDTFLILSIIPLSFLGGFVGHLLLGMKMSMPSFIGLVGLAGVVINDAIIMLSFLKKAKFISDIPRLSSLRLRPILITSITTFIGLSTLIFFATGQAKILQPIAVSLGFGLIWGTILTLIWLPLFYIILKKVPHG